ncbi:MAG: tRNA preQ1(34) S-adenosylmethionine ribosyltransferase-isomerase QueA [Bordetella sp.]|nr:MAG: tRNA preQ1(34) S-adenosylmethionine ribosyltransferase-isomerase QueA [Bordetella sp.]
MSKVLSLSDFDYFLPSKLIAQFPSKKRGNSKLLHLDNQGKLSDLHFSDLINLLHYDDVLIFNDTRVINARLNGRKKTGGNVKILVEQIIGKYCATAYVKSNTPSKPGTIFRINDSFDIVVVKISNQLLYLNFPEPVLDLLETHGVTPLPPYIKRTPNLKDKDRYQTVYAKEVGAIAAPTAGLHFTKQMLNKLKNFGIKIEFVTLHVGSGTFSPIRSENPKNHIMHKEFYSVTQKTVDAVSRAKSLGKRVIAVGTTTVRALESSAHYAVLNNSDRTDLLSPITGSTDIFITPGYKYKIVDALITNFHFPKSTLIMLVSALAGVISIQKAYEHAIKNQYQFFSYGDAMFIEANNI